MSDYMACPVCKQNDWQIIATRDFKKSDADQMTVYHQHIYHFMFEIWFPTESVITFKNIYCSNCGFICFYPRPDIEILHNFFQIRSAENQRELLQKEKNGTILNYHPKTDIEIANRRSKVLYKYIAKNHNLQTTQRVLDYSGSDGNLMREFIDNGKECFLTDFCQVTMPGVTRLGNTVSDLKPEDKFDLIVCSHIMEHTVDPRDTISRLLSHLSDDGILYIEVPLEIWKRPPLKTQTEPITHLNYFSPNSLRNLFAASNASVKKCEMSEFLHTDNNWFPGIRCIGQKQEGNIQQTPTCKPDGMSFLNPGFPTYLKYYLNNPTKLKTELAKHFRKKGVIRKKGVRHLFRQDR